MPCISQCVECSGKRGTSCSPAKSKLSVICREKFTWFITYRGAAVSVRVVDVNHRRSLVQEGLEIPTEVSIVMHSDVNKHALETYATLISEHYGESVNGKLADAAANILVGMASNTDESDTEKRKRY